MTGLALEGGGVRGSYEAGAYMAFYDCKIKIDGVCGTSIGALNGAVIASGNGKILPELWQSLEMGKVFGFSDSFSNALIEKEYNLSFFKSIIEGFFHIIKNKGVELVGVKSLIDKYLDVEALYKSKMDFGLCTVKLKSFTPLYLFKENMSEDKVKDYILASACLPIFKLEKMIDDSYYLDGGFYDIGPVNMLLNKGYDKIYLVKVHGIGITRKYDKTKNVITIEPIRSLGSVMELNPKRISENIKMGYYDTLRVLKNYDGYHYVFKRRKIKYYKFLNRKVPKKLYRRVKNFFKTSNYKDTTIKALEYIMQKENIDYYDIYNPYKILKKLKKTANNTHFIYRYIKKLKHFI
ncbi:MAG: patatin-like phospholipase family protein [Ruminococcus sp.]|nr:patatin-like phospholipase family protein [Ruminococcus sp.]